MREPKFKSCDKCKPSTWIICVECGKHYCKHNGDTYCSNCQRIEKQLDRVTVLYAGRMSAVVWRTEYGIYSSQGTNVEYYRRKDGQEWLDAATTLGYTAHLRRVPNYSKGRDWYGRPYGMSMATFELWVEMVPTCTPAEIGREIKAKRNDWRIEDLEERLKKPRAEWSYNDYETYHRLTGTL